MGVIVSETDFGTKQRAIDATIRVEKHADENFERLIEDWWRRVRDLAKKLCREMGAYDTGTLERSIRIIYGTISGAHYEMYIGVGPIRREITIDRVLVAGGGMFINPRTGKICDYALSVHEGTGMNWQKGPRPFLEMAFEIMYPELEALMNRFMTEQGKEWERN